MPKKEDGGPAFPAPSVYGHQDAVEHETGEYGMSLRDWFAGQAVTGLVQFADAPTQLKPAEMAEAAYKIADAMLAARR